VTRVKICGVNSPAAFDAAVEAGADWIGFVFFARSPRFVTPAQAATLSGRHAGGPARVGLFVEPTDDEIACALASLPLDILQIYAAPRRADDAAARFGLPVWRAVHVGKKADLPADAGAAAALLIEPRPPAGASRPGGNAVRLDFSLLAGWRPAFAWLLAGGLKPQNVADAVTATGAPAVDVSSGVETARGEKSPALIRAFIAAARAGISPLPAPPGLG
jgi:phosphoribosylanthranilate isomerase